MTDFHVGDQVEIHQYGGMPYDPPLPATVITGDSDSFIYVRTNDGIRWPCNRNELQQAKPAGHTSHDDWEPC